MKIKEILKDIFPEMSDIIVLNEVCFNTNEDISDDFVKAFTKYSSLKNFCTYLEKITSIEGEKTELNQQKEEKEKKLTEKINALEQEKNQLIQNASAKENELNEKTENKVDSSKEIELMKQTLEEKEKTIKEIQQKIEQEVKEKKELILHFFL